VRLDIGMIALLAASLVGCADEESCFDRYPNGAPKDPWFPPRHVEYDSLLDRDTLACTHTEFDEACIGQDECYCHFRSITNRVTTDVACSDERCGGVDETTCLARYDCFVARNATSNAYIGCYSPMSIITWTVPCTMRTTPDDCGRGAQCVGLYAATSPVTWGFVSCTDE
jgi:hypothetical protein